MCTVLQLFIHVHCRRPPFADATFANVLLMATMCGWFVVWGLSEKWWFLFSWEKCPRWKGKTSQAVSVEEKSVACLVLLQRPLKSEIVGVVLVIVPVW
ncbi:hypothetical protein AVEN_103946-1 [Araneus ventricosus]|uniref:Uncharacterized protein n=1 Tax=Araneus ventricosus TaxID=182803 RepID=A0A4Y2I8U1_ARAVE|nr:hypothetical protein AVEN_103946-1 [Araneus ventricosus]